MDSKLNYIDIHSHLGFDDYGPDQKEVLKRMAEKRVGTITIGTNLTDSQEALKIAEANENVWACIGVHPKEGTSAPVFDEAEFEKLVVHPKVVAIGECGLDYFKLEGDIEAIRANQRKVFIQQIEFAIKHNKPLMLHLRDGEKKREAYEDVYNILREYKGKVKGNVHFFTANLEWAQKFIALGFTISFIGLITYVQDFNKIIKNVPLESLHAETDAPFVAPVPHRGERNEPSYVTHVYAKIAEIRGEEPEKVRLQLLENAKKLFNIKL
jgi:TatD DNase family protein